jgi:hypothetical protein
MRYGVGMNETLESLKLNTRLCDGNSTMWCRALSFLRINKTLKSLLVAAFDAGALESCASTLRSDIACMLQENASLERLTIQSSIITKIKADDYFVLVTALQRNKTLKRLRFHFTPSSSIPRLNNDENNQMVSLLKKNFALESLADINPVGDVGAILRLNGAGRRYLVQDGSSISKGVEVLSKVNDDINCVFFHLLENPRLCDRSAVEMVTGADESNSSSRSVNESNCM